MSDEKITTLIQKCLLIAPEKRNVGTAERIVSSTLGAFFCTLGLRRIGKGGLCLLMPGSYLLWRSASAYCPISEALGWDTTEGAESFRLRKSVTIQRPADELYRIWRDLEQLPKYLKHIKAVKKINETEYDWTASFNGQEFTWRSEILEDIPNERISWRSVDPQDVENYGRVKFIDMPETGSTRFQFLLIYQPAKTELGRWVASVLNPIFRLTVKDDLRRFRDQMEAVGS